MKKRILLTIIALIGLSAVEAQQGVNFTWDRSRITQVVLRVFRNGSSYTNDATSTVESVEVFAVPNAVLVKINAPAGWDGAFPSDFGRGGYYTATLTFLFKGFSRDGYTENLHYSDVEEINPETFETIRSGYTAVMGYQNGRSVILIARGTVQYVTISAWD